MADKNYYDVLTNWLKNAYNIETTLVQMLDNQAERAGGFTELRSQLHGHREATQRHAQMVKECLEYLGEDVSEVRAQASKLFGEVQSRMVGVYGDSIVRDAIVGAMVEQLEISTYSAIITLADQLGEQKIVNNCSEILEDERNMHGFLEDHLEKVVNRAYEEDLLTK